MLNQTSCYLQDLSPDSGIAGGNHEPYVPENSNLKRRLLFHESEGWQQALDAKRLVRDPQIAQFTLDQIRAARASTSHMRDRASYDVQVAYVHPAVQALLQPSCDLSHPLASEPVLLAKRFQRSRPSAVPTVKLVKDLRISPMG